MIDEANVSQKSALAFAEMVWLMDSTSLPWKETALKMMSSMINSATIIRIVLVF